MNTSALFSSLLRRLASATVLWVIFWPIFWYLRIGDITGPKSWFWIIGELNYPIAALCFITVDGMLRLSLKTGWRLFVLTTLLVTAVMPFFYHRFGFSIAVLLEAILF